MKYPHYIVTGVDRKGKRFRLKHQSLLWACSINLWRGSVWAKDSEKEPRRLIRRVFN